MKNELISAVRHVSVLKRQSINGSSPPNHEDDDPNELFDKIPTTRVEDMTNGDAMQIMLAGYLKKLEVIPKVEALQCYADILDGLSQPESARKRGISPSSTQRRVQEVQRALAAVNRQHHDMVSMIDLEHLSVDMAARFVNDLRRGIQRIIDEKSRQPAHAR